ncbi:hypothetical protein CU098_003085, partial [Rhizopus stolonifer]
SCTHNKPLEICKDITDDIESKYERRKTKTQKIKTLRTQRFVTTTSNKRLRAEIEKEATSFQSSSQRSQSSYEPNTDTSENEIDDLKSMVVNMLDVAFMLNHIVTLEN